MSEAKKPPSLGQRVALSQSVEYQDGKETKKATSGILAYLRPEEHDAWLVVCDELGFPREDVKPIQVRQQWIEGVQTRDDDTITEGVKALFIGQGDAEFADKIQAVVLNRDDYLSTQIMLKDHKSESVESFKQIEGLLSYIQDRYEHTPEKLVGMLFGRVPSSRMTAQNILADADEIEE